MEYKNGISIDCAGNS